MQENETAQEVHKEFLCCHVKKKGVAFLDLRLCSQYSTVVISKP
jgi:hypothetical protein